MFLKVWRLYRSQDSGVKRQFETKQQMSVAKVKIRHPRIHTHTIPRFTSFGGPNQDDLEELEHLDTSPGFLGILDVQKILVGATALLHYCLRWHDPGVVLQIRNIPGTEPPQ